MDFSWDNGNIAHIAKHEVTPAEAEQVIENNPFDVQQESRNGESRTFNLGETSAGRILVVIVTSRQEKIRVVTARVANKKERKFYLNQKDIYDA
jgi:uncharacterized DUF497 family protein